MQGTELALRIPPFRGNARKMLDFRSVDGGAGGLGHFILQRRKRTVLLSR